MSILSVNHRLINVGDSYSAGNGIDITNNIISVTGDSVPYSAGDNIDIQDHIISGKDWSNDIENASANAYNVTTAWVQDNYANSADMTYISAMVDTKLDTSAWSSVSGDLATESYVIMADNINYAQATAYVENQNYANKDFVLANIDSATSGKLDSSSFASVSSDFLTTAFGISESGAWNEATNCVENNSAAWFDNKGDVEVNELVYSQSANWNEISSKLDSTAFDTWRNGQYSTDLQTIEGQIANKLDYSSFSDVSGTFYTNDNPSGFITGVDLSNYYTKDETSGKEELANAFANIPAGDTEVNAYVHNNSASIDESTNVVQSNSSVWNDITAYQSNSASYLTGVDLTPYVPASSIGTQYSTTSVFGGETFVTAISGFRINASSADYASTAGGAEEARRARSAIYANYDYEGNNLVDDHNSLTSLKDVVRSNSAQWAEGGGGEIPESVSAATDYVNATSGNINDTINNVTTNSGAWGGAALPISARDGIDLEINNNILYIGASALTGCVPQSAFDELKASYDALSSLFATYSGQWLLPNEGV